ncbi:MAG TPA: hypothetical protein VLC55_13490 [Burkholderiales bacterium]|nr:hypothetical protein [Burkholderiales bacterium]
MSLKNTLLLTAIIAAMSGTLAAGAADDKATPAREGTTVEKTAPDAAKAKSDAPAKDADKQAAPKKTVKAKKVKPHDHSSFHKSGLETDPAAIPPEAPEAPKAQAHDHQKFHK